MSKRTDLMLRPQNEKAPADLMPQSEGIDWDADNIVMFFGRERVRCAPPARTKTPPAPGVAPRAKKHKRQRRGA
jgi:hypothetical protein